MKYFLYIVATISFLCGMFVNSSAMASIVPNSVMSVAPSVPIMVVHNLHDPLHYYSINGKTGASQTVNATSNVTDGQQAFAVNADGSSIDIAMVKPAGTINLSVTNDLGAHWKSTQANYPGVTQTLRLYFSGNSLYLFVVDSGEYQLLTSDDAGASWSLVHTFCAMQNPNETVATYFFNYQGNVRIGFATSNYIAVGGSSSLGQNNAAYVWHQQSNPGQFGLQGNKIYSICYGIEARVAIVTNAGVFTNDTPLGSWKPNTPSGLARMIKKAGATGLSYGHIYVMMNSMILSANIDSLGLTGFYMTDFFGKWSAADQGLPASSEGNFATGFYLNTDGSAIYMPESMSNPMVLYKMDPSKKTWKPVPSTTS